MNLTQDNTSGPWLVTGATGMLGRAFVQMWASNCIAMVRNATQLPCESISGILAEPSSITKVVEKLRPSVCFHFAACTNLSHCEQYPAYANQINATASAAIAEACSGVGTRVVYMCTDSIFDGEKGNYAEGDNPAPLNSYARSKLRGERAILAASERNISVRGNIIGTEGPQSTSLKLYDWALKSLRKRAQITGFTDSIFNPLTVSTLSEIMGKIVKLDFPGGCWHVGTRNTISKDQFIRQIAKMHCLSDECVASGLQRNVNLQPIRPLNTTLQTLKIEIAGITMPTIETELDSIGKII